MAPKKKARKDGADSSTQQESPVIGTPIDMRIQSSANTSVPKRRRGPGKKEREEAGPTVPRCRRYAFTCYEGAPDNPPPISKDPAKVRFWIFQAEICPDTKRPHFQGYIEFKNPPRYKEAKQLIGRECHLSTAFAKAEQNIAYCSKKESRAYPDVEPTQWGTSASGPASGGARKSGISQELMDAIWKKGWKEAKIRRKFPTMYLAHMKRIQEMLSEAFSKRQGPTRPVFVEVRWGSHGCGKSHSVIDTPEARTANALFPVPLRCWKADKVFIKRSLKDWMCGYKNQPVLMLDDCVPMTEAHLLLLLAVFDKYTYQAEVKGSTVCTTWKHVVVTCNIPPGAWFHDPRSIDRRKTIEQQVHDGTLEYTVVEELRLALLDRLDKITKFEGASKRRVAGVQAREYSESDDDDDSEDEDEEQQTECITDEEAEEEDDTGSEMSTDDALPQSLSAARLDDDDVATPVIPPPPRITVPMLTDEDIDLYGVD